MKEPLLIGRPPLIRQTNSQILLNLLREKGPCSKADLVRASGLSAPSVTNVVAHLAQAGVVEAIGEGDSTGGRPPDILRFRAERGCVVGVEVGADVLHFLLCDLNGHELGRTRVAIERAGSTPSVVCRTIGQAVRDLLQKHKQSENLLLGLAVGVPAIVNVDAGRVVAYSALPDWNDVPLGDMLSREFRCLVTIENDTNLAAQGEFYRGAAVGQKDFVFITIGDGVGSGIFIDGRLHRGSQWSAGEIGYLRVPNVSRGNPTIHQYGNLEKSLHAPGIMKAWKSSLQASRAKPKVLHARDVFDLASGGNALAKRIVKQCATVLADTILDLALILNPSVILLGGEVGSHPFLLQEVQNLLEGSEFALVRVQPGGLGSSAVLWGAVFTTLEPAIFGLLQNSTHSS